MTRDPLASGDLIAERRFAYARAAAEEGDLGAAAEMFEQALERAPGWAAAAFALGETREKLGDLDAAARAFRMSLAADSADAQGAAARLQLIGRGEALRALPEAYVARLFDQYAPRFDSHLVGKLSYRAPALIAGALAAAAPGRRFASALDIGCGAGLMGEALRGRVDQMTGVDLSPAMIAKARERGIYDALVACGAAALLEREPPGAFDLIVAADSLVYIGDLQPLFAAVAAALTPDGLFAFSVELFEGDGYRLEPTMRFAHARAYVEATAGQADLRPLVVQSASTRREAGADAPGLICVFERTGGLAGPDQALRRAATNRPAPGTPAQPGSAAPPAAGRPSGNGRRNRSGPSGP
jgi:predicted TPR repeat methyltransferase